MFSKRLLGWLAVVSLFMIGSGCDPFSSSDLTGICNSGDTCWNDSISCSGTAYDCCMASASCSASMQLGRIKYVPALNTWGIVPDGAKDYYAISSGLDPDMEVDGLKVGFIGSVTPSPESCTPDEAFYPGGCSDGQIGVSNLFPRGAALYETPTTPQTFPTGVIDPSGNSILNADMSISCAPQNGNPVQVISETVWGQFVPSEPEICTTTVTAPGFIGQTVVWEVIQKFYGFELFGPTMITLQPNS